MSIQNKKAILGIIICIAAILGLCLGLVLLNNSRTDSTTVPAEEAEADLESSPKDQISYTSLVQEIEAQLWEAEHDGILLTNFLQDSFQTKDISRYLGKQMLKIQEPPVEEYQLEILLQHMLEADLSREYILGIDPYILRKQYDTTANMTSALREHMVKAIETRPEVNVNIFLPFYEYGYWKQAMEDQDQLKEAYVEFVGACSQVNNIKIYFLGAEEWLVLNTSNYMEDGNLNPLLCQKLVAFTLCDGWYSVDHDLIEAQMEQLFHNIEAHTDYLSNEYSLKGMELVMLGDSIFVYGDNTTSIPDVVAGLFHASVHNYSKGGRAAGEELKSVIDSFLEETELNRELPVCFLLEFGLNDYFNGIPLKREEAKDTETYEGAMCYAVNRIREEFPNAILFMMGPGESAAYNYGTEPHGENHYVLRDYYDMAREIASASEIQYIDLYEYFEGVNPMELTHDGTHYTEAARWTLGKLIGETVLNKIKKIEN